MNLLSTPFDDQDLPKPAPGVWSPARSVPGLPALPEAGGLSDAALPPLATPWDAVEVPATQFPTISALPTL